MLRDDTSPVKVRIKSMSETMSRLAFSACGNTRETLDPPAVDRAVPAHDYWTFLIAQCWNQLARMNIHQLMIGRLETEPRVASFILGLALRSVALPMSRTDIANYLVINCDTLSRTMMRFCDCGLIERESRRAVCVINLDALRKRSPLASLLSAVFEKSALGVTRKETRPCPQPTKIMASFLRL